jgi:Rrf2 family protein
MKISTRARYGIRAIIDIAIYGIDRPVMAKDIVSRQHISKKYLEQILTSLKEKGFIRTIRGSRGGYMLAKSPESITLKEVIESLEGPIELVDCVGSMRGCPLSDDCFARDIWKEISDAIEAKLKGMTLKDIVTRIIQRKKTEEYVYFI